MGEKSVVILEDADSRSFCRINGAGCFGSCGTALYRDHRAIVVENIADELWTGLRSVPGRLRIVTEWMRNGDGPQRGRKSFKTVLKYIDIGLEDGQLLFAAVRPRVAKV